MKRQLVKIKSSLLPTIIYKCKKTLQLSTSLISTSTIILSSIKVIKTDINIFTLAQNY